MSTVRCKFAQQPTKGRRRARSQRSARSKPVSRAARMLALAHHVERLIEAGELQGYAEAARALGLTRARLTQITKLVLLAPEIQGHLVLGEATASERALRAAVAAPNWEDQLALAAHQSDHGRV